jgi:hypothetical protein
MFNTKKIEDLKELALLGQDNTFAACFWQKQALLLSPLTAIRPLKLNAVRNIADIEIFLSLQTI